MSLHIPTPRAHLDDGDVMRFIDEEGSDAEHRRWTEHVAACDRCRRAVSGMRARDAAVRGWIRRAEIEAGDPLVVTRAPASPPAGRSSRNGADPSERAAGSRRSGGHGRPVGFGAGRGRLPWLRIAAAILLVAAPLVASPAAREWVAERLPGVPAPERQAPAGDDALRAPSLDRPVLRFVPVPGPFVLELDQVPSGTILVLERTPGPEARLDIRTASAAPTAAVATTVSPGGLTVRRADPGVTELRLGLPAEVTGVELRLAGGREGATVATDRIDRGETIRIGAGGR